MGRLVSELLVITCRISAGLVGTCPITVGLVGTWRDGAELHDLLDLVGTKHSVSQLNVTGLIGFGSKRDLSDLKVTCRT